MNRLLNSLQVGGVFVLGPGNACDFMFRSAFVGDIPDMQEVGEQLRNYYVIFYLNSSF